MIPSGSGLRRAGVVLVLETIDDEDDDEDEGKREREGKRRKGPTGESLPEDFHIERDDVFSHPGKAELLANGFRRRVEDALAEF